MYFRSSRSLENRNLNPSNAAGVPSRRETHAFQFRDLSTALFLSVCVCLGIAEIALARSGAESDPQTGLQWKSLHSGFFQGQQGQPGTSQGRKAPGTDSNEVRKGGGGFLGAYLGDIDAARARELKLSDPVGAYIARVEEGSPGNKAGLMENDVILSFNEQKIQNRTQLFHLLESSIPGSKVALGISRDGSPQTLSVVLGERRRAVFDQQERLFSEANAYLSMADELRKQMEEARQKGDEKNAVRLAEEEQKVRKIAEESRAFTEKELREGRIQLAPNSLRPDQTVSLYRYNLGLTAIMLNDQMSAFFNANGAGVLVVEVRAGELAERAGIKTGDCIVMINGERVKSLADLTRNRVGADGKEPSELNVTLVRDRVEQNVKIRLDPR
jgi:C-terminal processing protease CtpA/Prc